MKEKLQALVVCMSLTALVVSVGTPYFHGGKPTVADEQRELEESIALCEVMLDWSDQQQASCKASIALCKTSGSTEDCANRDRV